jgi:hypothetical protein
VSFIATKPIDPKPLLQYLKTQGGECSFDQAVQTLEVQGLDANDARDTLWRWLAQGIIEFTTDRFLRLPRANEATR